MNYVMAGGLRPYPPGGRRGHSCLLLIGPTYACAAFPLSRKSGSSRPIGKVLRELITAGSILSLYAAGFDRISD